MSYNQTIYEVVNKMVSEDKLGNTKISEYVEYNQRETIEKIEAYLNSKHISGETDHLGREKPFFNIVTAAVNIWFRATDIDRKNIRIRADKHSEVVPAFLATILLQEWMRKNNFGKFLNEWGRVLARYGSAVSKYVEKDGELIAEVIPWHRLICDPVDFENNVKIERLWFTPAQLKKNKVYDKELVKKLCDNLETRKTMDGQTKDTKSEYIEIFEVHGELPLSYLTGNEDDEDEYVQQMHVLTLKEKKDSDEEYKAHCLYQGREAKDPYQITHLIKEDGRTLAIGAVEHLFEPQWMVNHSQKQIKDHLDLASKMLFQTSDGNLVGQNALTNIENGDILIHQINQPLTQLNNKADIGAIVANQGQWQQIGNQINGINEAMAGVNPPSGTAWRLQQALLQESHSLFELMTENKGLALEDMLRDFVIPHFKKKLNHKEEIFAILTDSQIKEIDRMYVPNEAIRRVNQIIKDTVLSGEIYDPTQQAGQIAQTEQDLRTQLSTLGNGRPLKPSDLDDKTWKEIVGKMDNLEVDITGEVKDTQGAMTTLTTALQTIATNPMILQEPNAKMIFSKILELTGTISPLEIQSNSQAPMQPAMMPQPA